MKRIYLDHAAATPMDSRVKREILSHLNAFGNPSSLHKSGLRAKAIIDNARVSIAKILNCRPGEIIFTGSGSEANNLAISQPYTHIISTTIEHHSILRPLQKHGNVTFVPVKSNGIVDPQEIAKAIKPNTQLISVIYANNEIGTIQPIKNIKKAIGKKMLLHIDACQAAGALNLNVQELGVDLMTINASKIYGPKGVGCLFVRRGTKMQPQILGGDQERGLRAGTENPALIAGFAKALEIADSMKEKENARLIKLRDWFISQIPEVKINGDPVMRLANNINISFAGVDGEMLMLSLDARGIEVSTGAACTVSSNEASHVLQALSPSHPPAITPSFPLIDKGDAREIVGNLRITLGRSTTKKDLVQAVKILNEEVARLRAL